MTTREFWLGAGATILAALVACIASFATCRAFRSVDPEHTVRMEVPSPTGKQRAILYVGEGGRAAGGCHQRLAVAATDAIFDPKVVDSELEYVFSAGCESQVSPRWASERELEVSYSLGGSAGTSVYQRPSTPDGLVTLSFATQP